jgi:putative acetyltransferase
LETISALSQPNVALFGVFVAVELVVCGGVKSADDDGSYAEIKRVFVDRRYRGRGLAKLLMKQLEEHALESGLCVLRLETGVKQPEALGLYQRLGYRLRGPFGRYTNDPLSVYMEKVVQKA